ncbi:UNVERIFIED_CONTAM: hypothetical protein GTU68_049315 [Idotea baltica]|nr:hypothetical protein [Idotea baltica]
MAELRGAEISMVFQNPMTSLNPSMRIGRQVQEPVEVHDKSVSQTDLDALAIKMLEEVGIPNPPLRTTQYPHEFSGGMRQRAVIAMALSGEPSVLVADEPTTALDVTVQAQIVSVLRELSRKRNVASIVITHDLGLVAELVDRVMVMYAGRIVEETQVADLFNKPAHPYTRALLRSRPTATEAAHPDQRHKDKFVVSGSPPDPANIPSGCGFRLRCPLATEICAQKRPELQTVSGRGHQVACHFGDDLTSLDALSTLQTAELQPQESKQL